MAISRDAGTILAKADERDAALRISGHESTEGTESIETELVAKKLFFCRYGARSIEHTIRAFNNANLPSLLGLAPKRFVYCIRPKICPYDRDAISLVISGINRQCSGMIAEYVIHHKADSGTLLEVMDPEECQEHPQIDSSTILRSFDPAQTTGKQSTASCCSTTDPYSKVAKKIV